MSKQMLIETSSARARVAIVEDGHLVDYDVEEQERESLKGNIYKGIIANVERGLDATFVDFGVAKQGFLPISEIRRDAIVHTHAKAGSRAPVAELLRRHQEVVVQVTKEEIGHKGAALSTYLSFPGRYCVLMHSEGGRGGVSRKIEDEERRQRAREILTKLNVPDGYGLIIRTAGMDRTKTELQRDLNALMRTLRSVEKAAKIGRAPTLLYREPDMVVRTIRDYLLPDVETIIVDDPDEFEEARAFFDATMPKQKHILQLYQDSQPLFSAYGIDEQIARTAQRKVRLPSGGEIVIDQTEALVAIDVNSSRSTKEKGHEETVYKTNLEAAGEIARQLRLRDLGGLVVIDFIDHASRKHDKAVEKKLREALKADKARTTIGRISKFGLLEMTRQRLRRTHSAAGSTACPTCGGAGTVQDAAARAQEVVREIRTRLSSHGSSLQALRVDIDVDTANLLFNERRAELDDIERRSGVRLSLRVDPELRLRPPQFEERRGAPAQPPPPPQEPHHPPAPESADAGPQAGTAEGAAAPGEPRKRRRRRRSKRGGAGAASGATSPDDPAVAAEQEVEATAAGDELGVPTAPAPPQVLPATAAAEEQPADAAPASQDDVEIVDELSEALFGAGPVPEDGFGALFSGASSARADEPGRRKRRRRRRKKGRAEAAGDELPGLERGALPVDAGGDDGVDAPTAGNEGDVTDRQEVADAAAVPPPPRVATPEIEG